MNNKSLEITMAWDLATGSDQSILCFRHGCTLKIIQLVKNLNSKINSVSHFTQYINRQLLSNTYISTLE